MEKKINKIMFQGTGSSVGKSLITAGICRILSDRGLKVAPFKSQNMALNSYITDDGKEIGRAQVVQAEAARTKPIVEMNPILLKPTDSMGSQVIIEGEVYKNMKAKEYHLFKPELKILVLNAFNRLAEKYDNIIIEGAGSPAEINLRENDIVNMGLAELVDSPVILVGDIDRGGVFASIYGTIMLMREEERNRIKGFIINKFRGDVEILKPGIHMIEEKINIPCLGVVPMANIDIEEEDSLSTKFTKKERKLINIGIVKLPFISNFTDFSPLEREKDVSINYILDPKEVLDMDFLIIPGSKNTIEDMKYLKDNRFPEYIFKAQKNGTSIMGICGGYQILGEEIIDDFNVESSLEKINGLSLLETKTYMSKEKSQRQVKGYLLDTPNIMKNSGIELSNRSIKGYEIHMGRTVDNSKNNRYLLKLEDGSYDGRISENGKVFGTYLHGIFENDDFRKAIINSIKNSKGIAEDMSEFSYEDYKENEYNKLANVLKESLNIDKIIDIMSENK